MIYQRMYGRDDVNYQTWYSDWSKSLAKIYTKQEIEKSLGIAQVKLSDAARTHHNAVARSTSMTSNSQRRAQSRNVVAASGELAIALRCALEIHELFPEHAKGVSEQ